MKEHSYGIIPFHRHHGRWEVFLVLHFNGYHWGFPKGKADGKETSLETARRELYEETGLQVEKLLVEDPISEHYTFKRNNLMVDKKVDYYLALCSGELNLQTEEIRDGKWLSLDSAYELLTFSEAKELLKKSQQLILSQ